MFDELFKKVIIPLFQASGLKEEDVLRQKTVLEVLIIGQLAQKLDKSLAEEESKKLDEKITAEETLSGKMAVLEEIVANNEEVKRGVEDYFKNDLPKLVNELIDSFIDEASQKQKDDLKNRVAQANA